MCFALSVGYRQFLSSASGEVFLLSSDVAGSDSSDAKPGGLFFSGKPVIRHAMELADGVMFDSPEKRLKMPVCMDPSDDEDDDEEEMEVIMLAVCH